MATPSDDLREYLDNLQFTIIDELTPIPKTLLPITDPSHDYSHKDYTQACEIRRETKSIVLKYPLWVGVSREDISGKVHYFDRRIETYAEAQLIFASRLAGTVAYLSELIGQSVTKSRDRFIDLIVCYR